MTLLNRTTAAASFPVTLDEAKAHLRVDLTDEDPLIDGLIASATATVEEMSGRPLIAQTWDLSMNGASGEVVLPMTPVQSLGAITYYDADEAPQTADVADFHLFRDLQRAWVEPKTGKAWPDVFSRPDGLTISFIAGYGTAAEDVPVEIRQAILVVIAHWYENRGLVKWGTLSRPIELTVNALIGLHRRGWVGA